MAIWVTRLCPLTTPPDARLSAMPSTAAWPSTSTLRETPRLILVQERAAVRIPQGQWSRRYKATPHTNPRSVTMIKCVFWGGPVNAGNANNYGQYRNQFQVLIAGSNGYVNNTIVPPPGYGTAVDLGTSAINAP